MPVATLDAIILQAFPYSETSKILRLLTPTHGVVSVIAKGALRPRSRYGGVLEPFTEGLATAYLKPGRELQTLSAFDLVRARQGLGRDLVRFGAASLLAEIVIRTAAETADARLYEQVRAALDRLGGATVDVEAVALAELWSLVAQLGFAPALDACVDCGRALAADEETSFDYAAGAVRCDECARQAPGRTLPAAARAALEQLQRGEAPALARTAAHWRLLARYLAHHVLEGQPLHSLDFLTETIGAES